jgi:hypothetical protein
MHNKIADIHARYGVYPKNLLYQVKDNCILDDLKKIKELSYLYEFYKMYFFKYEASFRRNDEAVMHWDVSLKSQLRNVDLPFIGPNVIENNKAKFFWIFQGSLQPELRLTMTVLSCLWLIDDIGKHHNKDILNDIIDNYWIHNAYYEKKLALRINSMVAKYSYVVDAQKLRNRKRRPDNKSNRNLLHEEINLFNPNLIIAVGRTAEDTLGEKYIRENENRFIEVPFPRRWSPPTDKFKYEQLEERMHSLCA